MLRPTPSLPTSHAPSDVSSLVELAARMGVPSDYAIHRFIDRAVHHDGDEGAEPIRRPSASP